MQVFDQPAIDHEEGKGGWEDAEGGKPGQGFCAGHGHHDCVLQVLKNGQVEGGAEEDESQGQQLLPDGDGGLWQFDIL